MGCRASTYLSSSIGKKNIMGVTGLLLCGFLLSHLIGNLLIMVSPEAFNTYAYKLVTNPFILPMEIGLGTLFLVHIFLGLKLVLENKSARPESYYMKKHTGRGATFASSTMPYTGMIVLVFLIIHLIHFRFGPVYYVSYDGVEMRDLHKLVLEVFSQPAWLAWYVFAHLVLGLHVSHGFASCFQSLGFRHPRYTPKLECLAKLYAVVIAIGFSSIAIWCYFQGVN